MAEFTLEQIIEKVRGLLSLAERAGTEAEAANAAAAAQRLMAKYNIEQAMLDGSDDAAENEIGRDMWSAEASGFKKSRVSMAWESALASAIAGAHYCVIVKISGTNSIWFCGTPANRAVAMYMYTYLRRIGDQLARQEYHAAHRLGRVALNHSDLHPWRLGFFIGYRDALVKRYEEMAAQLRNEYAGNDRALMVINNALARTEQSFRSLFDEKLRNTASRASVNSEGYGRGQHHGERINLNTRGIEPGKAKAAPGRITDRTRLLGS